MHKVAFNLNLPRDHFGRIRALAELAEGLGYDSVSLGDHVFVHSKTGNFRSDSPYLECYVTLAALAVVTKRVRLVSLVSPVGFRNPALLAKMGSSIDQISGGRLTLGLGTGWFRGEYDAHGWPFPSSQERAEQLRECIAILKALWTEGETTFDGKHFKLTKAYNFPQPVQKPYPRLLIAGSGNRVLAIAGREADIAHIAPLANSSKRGFSTFTTSVLMERVGAMRASAKAAERDPGAVEIATTAEVFIGREKSDAQKAAQMTAAALGFATIEDAQKSPGLLIGTPEEIRRELRLRIAELGISYFCLRFGSQRSDAIELFAREIIPEFR